jgi:hypothetical protein
MLYRFDNMQQMSSTSIILIDSVKKAALFFIAWGLFVNLCRLRITQGVRPSKIPS